MHRFLSVVLPVTGLLLAQAVPVRRQPGAPIPPSPNDIQFPPLNPLKIPPVTRYTLANGITVFLVQDHELPVVHAEAIIRAGDRWDPPEKAGLATLTGEVMRTGGTAARGGDELDRELDRLGASVEMSVGQDATSASVFVLKQDTEKGLAILGDILRNPVFPQDKLDLLKTTLRASIARRNDDAGDIHSRETARLLHGRSSPYSLQPEYATLNAIRREDLVAFHTQYFQPEGLILGVWGDFTEAEMKPRIEKIFGSWPRRGNPKPPVPAVDVAGQGKGVHLLKKDDVVQSNVAFAFLVGRADHPDHASLTVMTRILGGGFGSRLFDSVRTSAGLAYNAGASYASEFDHAGSWRATASTKSETTAQLLELMQREMARMKQAEVTDIELQRAKDALLKGEAFDYDSTTKIISRLMNYEYFGYPADFLTRNREAIAKVSKADVLRVAKQYLDQDKFLTVVLGNPAKFDKPLSSFGPVTDVDYSIPEPKAEPAPPPAVDTEARGKDLLTKARQAHGGTALSSVQDYWAKFDMAMVTPQGEMVFKSEATVSLKGKSLMKMVAPMGEVQQGFDGNIVWLKTPQGVQEMPAAVAQARTAGAREMIPLLRNFDEPGYRTQALGSTKLDNKEVEAVLVANDQLNLQVKVFVDPATGLLAGKSYVGQTMGGPPGEMVESYSDIREVGGIKIPFRIVGNREGKRAVEQRLSEIKINTGVSDTAFAKP
jgi:predicted Zn-dependent peptidase